MPSRGKKYTQAAKSVQPERLYTPAEAVDLVKSMAPAKFDESVELSVRLGIDPRKADQALRGTVALPSGTGKNVRVAVFASGDAAEAAREAGADVVGAEDLVSKVDGGFMDFDVAIATPDVGRAVADFKGGRVEYRADARSHGVVQVPIGKVSFSREKLLDKFRAVLDELQRVKPASAKGRYLKGLAMSSTMGPGVDVDPTRTRVTDEELAAAGLGPAT